MQSYKYMLINSTDYDARTFPHCKFFFGVIDSGGNRSADPLADFNKLHEHLKMCFQLLYRYDMLARECGADLDWESEVALAVGWMWKVKTRWEYIENGKNVGVTRFV
jgi:hypothetical protein